MGPPSDECLQYIGIMGVTIVFYDWFCIYRVGRQVKSIVGLSYATAWRSHRTHHPDFFPRPPSVGRCYSTVLRRGSYYMMMMPAQHFGLTHQPVYKILEDHGRLFFSPLKLFIHHFSELKNVLTIPFPANVRINIIDYRHIFFCDHVSY